MRENLLVLEDESCCEVGVSESMLSDEWSIEVAASGFGDDYQWQVDCLETTIEGTALGDSGTSDVLLPYKVPQAEYMYGCTPTAVAMLLGYYDLYGYNGVDFSNMIEGDISVDSRGTDGNIYNMNAFDTVLGKFIASEDYVYRFVSRDDLSDITGSSSYDETTPEEELKYSFVDGGTELDTSSWNCLADYLGTGQYWRGVDNYSTSLAYATLETIMNMTSTVTITGDGYTRTVDRKYTSMMYGLHLYVESRGYSLNASDTGTFLTDNAGGGFTFEDYMNEIDAGRPVIVSIEGHSMIGYGYNADTREIIFDDDYRADQRMVWGESYYYSGAERALQSITVVSLRTQTGERDVSFEGTVQVSTGTSSPLFWSNEPMYVSFSVKNEGDTPCSLFKIAIKIDGVTYSELEVSQLAVDEIVQFSDVAIEGLTAGKHQLDIVLDSTDAIEETSESNNVYTKTISVMPEEMQVIDYYTVIQSGETISNAFIVSTDTTYGNVRLDGGYAETVILQGHYLGNNRGYTGAMTVLNGGIAKQVECLDWGWVYVSAGGRMEEVTLHSGGKAEIYSGGSMSDLAINSGGYAEIYDGGSMSDLMVNSRGGVYAYGGVAGNAVVDGTYSFYGSQGGLLSSATINGALYMYATGGASATDITLGSAGRAQVYSGCVLQDMTGNGGVTVASEGVVRRSEITSGGFVYVNNGGYSEDIVLHKGAFQRVSSGGTAIRTSAASGGVVDIYSSGYISSALIGSGGSMRLYSKAVAQDVFVEHGGIVSCAANGALRGKLEIAGSVLDATGETFEGVSNYVFHVQQFRDEAFLSFSSGGIAANASITIDVSNAWGDYLLVEGDLTELSSAAITIRSNGYSSGITADGTATLGDGKTGKLVREDGSWTLTVSGTDNTAPASPGNVTSSLTDNILQIAWQSVQDFSGVRYELEYSRQADFSDALCKSVTGTELALPLGNGHWYWRLRSVDGAGNVSDWSATYEIEVDYTKILDGTLTKTQTLYSDAIVTKGTDIRAGFPGGIQTLGDGSTITLQGNNTITCNSYRNAAILFGEDASWGEYYDGTVTFEGTSITLHSEVSNCITAAGVRGNNITLNFTGEASGAESIVFEASNGTSGPGNYAVGVYAAGDIVVNGDFGGTITCVMDCRELSSTRWGYMVGFYAVSGDLTFNGDMDGNIYLAGYETDDSTAYGLRSGGDLTVKGDVGGIIMATAEDIAYGLYGNGSITASISGIVFAGTTTEDNDRATLSDKLNAFSDNSEELLELSQGNYSVFTGGKADLSLTEDALLVGKLYVGKNSQITISNGASIYGDISTSYTTSLQFVLDDASLTGTRLVSSTWNSRLALTVTADNLETNGAYSLVEASNLSSVSKISLSVDGESHDLKTGYSVTLDGVTYSLANQKDSSTHTLVLTVSGIDYEPPVLVGQVQVEQGAGRTATLTWNAATDNTGVVGYELNWDGTVSVVTQTSVLLEDITLGNHTCQVRAFDAAGNYSAWSDVQTVVFTDETAPVLKSLTATPTLPTNQNVYIVAEYDDDFGDCHIQYRFSNETNWREYQGTVVVTENTVVSFRAIDDAGNVSEIEQFHVSNIDKVKPVISDIIADVTGPTNGRVVVTAHASDAASAVSLFYSQNGAEYVAYEDGVEFTSNGSVIFKAVDAVGNETFSDAFAVTNIDKVKPVISDIIADVTGLTNGKVVVTARASDAANAVSLFYSRNGADYVLYEDGVEFASNGSVIFKAVDAAGNETFSDAFAVTNIDTVKPVISDIVADVTDPTNGRVVVTARASDANAVSLFYSLNGAEYVPYEDGVEFTSNGSVIFKAVDAAGNETFSDAFVVSNIDTVKPVISDIIADVTELTNGRVIVTARASDAENAVSLFYSLNGAEYVAYEDGVEFTSNGSVIFKAVDAAGNETFSDAFVVSNIDTVKPEITELSVGTPRQDGSVLISLTVSEELEELYYSWDGGAWQELSGTQLSVSQNGTIAFRLTDMAGNIATTEAYSIRGFDVSLSDVQSQVVEQGISVLDWSGDDTTQWSQRYDVVLATDNGVILLEDFIAQGMEILNAPADGMAISVKPNQSEVWTDIDGTLSNPAPSDAGSQVVSGVEDGKLELMFANGTMTWSQHYKAEHVGVGPWKGTGNTVELAGKLVLDDVFLGSNDASVLLLTDASCGDALFVDNIYSAMPEGVDAQSRLAMIDEIRGGAGDDLIDLTSQRFTYEGDGLIVRGGLGDDVIWTNNGDNMLFGDAGDDQLVGASGNDVLVGGSGDDALHGGGGEDVFVFGDDWGNDTVTQLDSGKVTLWFAEGNLANWNETECTYSDGANKVKVMDVALENITLKFGHDEGDGRYAELLEAGAFEDYTSEKIFEDKNKGTLA